MGAFLFIFGLASVAYWILKFFNWHFENQPEIIALKKAIEKLEESTKTLKS